MRLPIYQIDAFADRPFEGNPAAVVPLEAWLPDEMMRAIAAENNLAETAFFVAEADGYRLRWFTPTVEVDLCGHATLATAHLILSRLEPERAHVAFETRSGTLTVSRGEEGLLQMDFPARPVKPMPASPEFDAALGRAPRVILTGANILAVFDRAADVAALEPDFRTLGAFLTPRNQVAIATAPGDVESGFDFVVRVFAPSHGVDEDSVTGSAYCDLTPHWARVLKKQSMAARQVSARGGTVWCEAAGERVVVRGRCADYLSGEIEVPA